MLNNFSPNMLKTYQTCPKKFYYKFVEKINIPQNFTPFEKGQKIHALANYFLKGVNISRIESALTFGEALIWNKLLDNNFFKKDCLKTEFSMQIKFNDFWLGGRIDAVVFEGDNYFILDYKTGAVPKNPQYDFQTMVYFLCLDKYLKNYSELSFVYIDLKNDKNFIIKFSQDLLLEYETILKNTLVKITDDKIYSCTSDINSCKFCEYNGICPKNDISDNVYF